MRHATTTVTPAGEVELHDRSPTGTWVHGERIWGHRLRAGDTVRIGDATLTFMAAPRAADEPARDIALIA
jgi:pSer/pThr/pTyr-binding forkhead associated (FHA) protein